MACYHGKESSAHQKSKPSTLSAQLGHKSSSASVHTPSLVTAHPGTAQHLEDSPCSAFSAA